MVFSLMTSIGVMTWLLNRNRGMKLKKAALVSVAGVVGYGLLLYGLFNPYYSLSRFGFLLCRLIVIGGLIGAYLKDRKRPVFPLIVLVLLSPGPVNFIQWLFN